MIPASLETNSLILRNWKKEDFLPFQQINADRNVMEYYPAPLTAPESDAIVERAMSHFSQNGFGLYAVELKKTGSLIGFIGLQKVPIQAHFTPAIELGCSRPHFINAKCPHPCPLIALKTKQSQVV